MHRKCNLCQVVPVNDDVAVAVDGVAVAVDGVAVDGVAVAVAVRRCSCS